MALVQSVLGCVIYAIVWLLLLKNSWKWLPLGRAMSSLAGAAAMVLCGVVTPSAAFSAINLPTLGLLTGCMLVSAHMEEQGLYTRLASSLSSIGSPLSFLLRVGLISALSSAFITNDTTCVILTRICITAAARRRLHPAPYLLALATCANVGSACSPIGNPQNMLIALTSGLSFIDFLATITAAAAAGVAITLVTIVVVYRRQVLGSDPVLYEWSEDTLKKLNVEGGGDAMPASERAPSTPRRYGTVESETVHILSAQAVQHASINLELEAPPKVAPPPQQQQRRCPTPAQLRRGAILTLLALFPFALIAADRFIGLAWVALTTAALLAAVAGVDPSPFIARVDGTLLFFFSGLFIVVDAFNATGVPEAAWGAVSSAVNMNSVTGLAAFTAIVLIASNVVSNVPLVLLLSPKLSSYTGLESRAAWAQLAFISTSAGNLTLLGSVANLIVAEQAKEFYTLTAGEYAIVGLPSTLLTCLAGVPLVRLCVGN